MKNKEVFWNEFGLEDYIDRLEELPGHRAERTDTIVKEAFSRLPHVVRQNPYHDKGRGIRKMNHKGEVILYQELETQIEVLGAFSERSNWMNARI